MRFGCCAAIGQAPLLRRLGYDYIELGVSTDLRPLEVTISPVYDIREKLHEASIPVDAFNLLVPGSLKITGPGRDPGLLYEYMTRACQRAKEVGAHILVFGSGGARQSPEGFSIDMAKTQVVEFLKTIADLVRVNNLTLVIEPLQIAECNVITSVLEAVEIARLVGREDAINVLSDLYHVECDAQDFAETASAGGLLKHVHVACGKDRHAPTWDDAEELIRYFTEVKKAGYDARVSVEANWTNFEASAVVALEVLKHTWSAAPRS